MSFRLHTLSNGLQILAEIQPRALSCAVGFFVETGARHETADIAGVSHFLEHMAFKGTPTRSADETNQAFDRIGAKYNAYTTEEHTVYHAAILPEFARPATLLLADLLRPALRDDDFQTEKQVILEEIGMYADSPIWSTYEKAMARYFAPHPLGQSVLGTPETVGDLTAEAMKNYHHQRYSPGQVLVAATGNIDWNLLIDTIDEKCGSWQPVTLSPQQIPDNKPGSQTDELVVSDRFSQQTVLRMIPAPPANHPMNLAAHLLTTAVGDDTGSKLYFALAEPGLVESVDLSYHEYADQGAYMLALSGRPEQSADNLAAALAVLEETTTQGLTDVELRQAQTKTAARMVLASEIPASRLGSLGDNWSYRKEYRHVQDDLSDLQALTRDDLQALLAAFPLTAGTTVTLGPLETLPGLREPVTSTY